MALRAHLEYVEVGEVLDLVAQLAQHGGEVLRVQLHHEYEDLVPAPKEQGLRVRLALQYMAFKIFGAGIEDQPSQTNV